MFWKAAGHALECVATLHRPDRKLETRELQRTKRTSPLYVGGRLRARRRARAGSVRRRRRRPRRRLTSRGPRVRIQSTFWRVGFSRRGARGSLERVYVWSVFLGEPHRRPVRERRWDRIDASRLGDLINVTKSSRDGNAHRDPDFGAQVLVADTAPLKSTPPRRALLSLSSWATFPLFVCFGTHTKCEEKRRFLRRLCARNPSVKFLCTFLSRVNQHEACVLAQKFRNLHLHLTPRIEARSLGVSLMPLPNDTYSAGTAAGGTATTPPSSPSSRCSASKCSAPPSPRTTASSIDLEFHVGRLRTGETGVGR